jgi:AraC-like DNA-binding protein
VLPQVLFLEAAMKKQYAVSISHVKAIVGAALQKGASIDELLVVAGLSQQDLADPDATVPNSIVVTLLDEAARRTGDPDFGLHMAELMVGEKRHHYLPAPFYYALRSSPTFGEAIQRSVRYVHLSNECAVTDLKVSGGIARFRSRMRPGIVSSRQQSETTLAFGFLWSRLHCNPDFSVHVVSFRHPRPPSIQEHERLFRAAVRFDCAIDELIFDAAELDRPLLDAEPALLRIVDDYLERRAGPRVRSSDLVEQVQRKIVEGLQGGAPTIDELAEHLSMSSRTLQRRLASEGTNYQMLFDGVRRELALHHLENPEYSISEVAFLLGFSEVSHFHRAVKRWTDQTPAGLRSTGAARSRRR